MTRPHHETATDRDARHPDRTPTPVAPSERDTAMAPPTPATPKPGTRATPPKPRRLLGIWPHPDDEAYLSAGLMGRTTDAGGHVTVLTLTRGTKGTSDPADYDQPQFGARRDTLRYRPPLAAADSSLNETDVAPLP